MQLLRTGRRGGRASRTKPHDIGSPLQLRRSISRDDKRRIGKTHASPPDHDAPIDADPGLS
jgi:hypothetical protein